MAPWAGYQHDGPKSPCYDRKTKTSCTKRSTFCRQSCEEWKRYEEMKAEEYERRKVERMRNDEYYTYVKKNNIEKEKTVQRLRGKKVLRGVMR